jgi:hypothetical protein
MAKAKKKRETAYASEKSTGDRGGGAAENWKSFMDMFDNEMRKIFGAGSAEYRRLSESWLELAESMTKNMPRGSTPGGAGGEGGTGGMNMYDTWLEGSRTMQKQFESILDADNPDHHRLFNMWNQEYQRLGETLTGQMVRSMREQYELYDTWLDSFSVKGAEGTGLDEMGGIVGRHYFDFMERLRKIATDVSGGPEGGKGEIPSMENLASAKTFTRIQEAWLATASGMMKDLMSSPAFGTSLRNGIDTHLKTQEFLDDLMEEELKRLRIPTRSQIDDIYKGLTDLERRVGAIQDALETTARRGGKEQAPKLAVRTPAPAPSRAKAAPKKGKAKAAPKKGKAKAAPKKGKVKAAPKKGKGVLAKGRKKTGKAGRR